MKDEDKSEIFFKKIALSYEQNEGELLRKELRELEEIENNVKYPALLDKKIENKIKRLKIAKVLYLLVPLAASLLITLVYINNPQLGHSLKITEQNIEMKKDIKFLSAKMPQGYEVTSLEYDKEKIIYYVVNNKGNNIVVTTEKFDTEIKEDYFEDIYINEKKGYILEKNDFTIIKYKKDNILYTLSSKYNKNDLIELSENLI